MTHAQLRIIREDLTGTLQKIRENAVSITDAFDFADRELNSVLGRRDGNVYENMYKWAQQSSLNQYEVLPFHHDTVGKMMKEERKKSKL